MEERHGVQKKMKSNFKENEESYGESHVPSESYRQKDNRRTDKHAGLKETVDGLATANEVRWYGHVLSREDNSVLIVAPDLIVSDMRKP